MVLSQMPVDGVRVKKGSQVLLSLQEISAVPAGERLVPNLKGKSLRAAAEILGAMNLILAPEGEQFPTGRAVWQEPAGGSRVMSGARIRVRFAAPLPLTSGP